MSIKPIIGITPDYSYDNRTYSLNEDYIAAIETAGGCAVILPPLSELPDFLDGIVLSGGGDIDPLLFGEEPIRQSGEISPVRDAYEMDLCRQALDKDIPLLGICRGMQVMNIATGGGIYQDIFVQTDTQLKHSQQAPRSYATHSILIEDGTLLAELWENKRTAVNSVHHQSISAVGKGFVVTARSADGLAEAIAHTEKRFAVGVQWHPEAMKTEEMGRLFTAFLAAAHAYQKDRR